jgi:transcriptional regulator with XRE-family HTH domain
MKQRFGKTLRKARDSNRLSRAKLGEMLGVSMKTIQSWEMGRTFPEDLDLIPDLENFLGIRFDRILTEQEHAEPAPVMQMAQTWELAASTSKRRQGRLRKGKEIYLPTPWLREPDLKVVAADHVVGRHFHGALYIAVRPLHPAEPSRGDYPMQDHLLVDDAGQFRMATTASRKRRWTYKVKQEDGSFIITPAANDWTCLGRILWMVSGLERFIG